MGWNPFTKLWGKSQPNILPRVRLPRMGRGESISFDEAVGKILSRNWEAADTTEENRLQWAKADGRTINEVLIDFGETICARAQLEARRNATVEGVIWSHAADVVGDEGPELQMQTDDDEWNTEAEQIFSEVAQTISGSGTLSLGEWLRQDIYQLWVSGDMLCQIVTDRLADTVVKTRIHPINPNRLRSPYTYTPNGNLMLGIERNTLGRPLYYHILDEIISEYQVQNFTTKQVPARDILHWFRELEPGQARGWPLMASCLQAISDLREYDNAVLDAAKVQAMLAVLMEATGDMVQAEENPADVTLKRQGITRMPIGWRGTPVNSTQPNANNTEFRSDRSRELGRPVGMPLMQIRLDSSGHNYSSARFDAQNYQKANRVIQGSIGRHRVRPVVMLTLSEAMERGILAPRVIRRDEVTFRWPQPPHVDPVKEAMAERIRLENKTLSPQDACLANNKDFETLCRDWKRANQILEANGLPPMLGGVPTSLPELMQWLGMTDQQQGADNGQTQKA